MPRLWRSISQIWGTFDSYSQSRCRSDPKYCWLCECAEKRRILILHKTTGSYTELSLHIGQHRTPLDTGFAWLVYKETSSNQLTPNHTILRASFYLGRSLRQKPIYDSLRREYYWPNTAADVYSTVKSGTDYLKMGTKLRHQCKLDLFPPSGPLEFVFIDILILIPRTSSGKQFVDIIAVRYIKLTRARPTTKITSTQDANIFFNQWLIFYSIPDIILSHIGQQFVGRVLKLTCICLGVKRLTTAKYHSKTSEEVDGNY